MWRFGIIVALLPIACVEDGGRPEDETDRIIGGERVDIRDFPYQVHIGFCGGSLIDDEWVLTAAHCVENIKPQDMQYQSVVAGTDNIWEPQRGQTRGWAEVHVHPQYDVGNLGRPVQSADIALIRVTEPFDLDQPDVSTIGLISPQDIAAGRVRPGELATISGWGYLEDNTFSPELRAVDIPVMSKQAAEDAFAHEWRVQPDEIPFGNGRPGAGACFGDSGGPAVVAYDDPLGVRVAGAAASWITSDACPGDVTVYSSVPFYYDWITGITGPRVEPGGSDNPIGGTAACDAYVAPSPCDDVDGTPVYCVSPGASLQVAGELRYPPDQPGNLPAMGVGRDKLGYIPVSWPMTCTPHPCQEGAGTGNSDNSGGKICEISFDDSSPRYEEAWGVYTIHIEDDAAAADYLFGFTANSGLEVRTPTFIVRVK